MIIFLHSACSSFPRHEQREQIAGNGQSIGQEAMESGVRKTMRALNWAQAGQLNEIKGYSLRPSQDLSRLSPALTAFYFYL